MILAGTSIGKNMGGQSFLAMESGRWKVQCLAQCLADGKHSLHIPDDPKDDDDRLCVTEVWSMGCLF